MAYGMMAAEPGIDVVPADLEQVGDQGGNRRPFGTVQRYVREERVALELLHDGDHSVVSANSEIVALCYVVRQYHARILADSTQHGQQDAALE